MVQLCLLYPSTMISSYKHMYWGVIVQCHINISHFISRTETDVYVYISNYSNNNDNKSNNSNSNNKNKNNNSCSDQY